MNYNPLPTKRNEYWMVEICTQNFFFISSIQESVEYSVFQFLNVKIAKSEFAFLTSFRFRTEQNVSPSAFTKKLEIHPQNSLLSV